MPNKPPEGNRPLFEDVALPGLEPEETKPAPRPKTAKERDDDERKVSWRRYKPTKPTQCDHCVERVAKGETNYISVASYTRTYRGETLYLCFMATQEQRHRDKLDGLG